MADTAAVRQWAREQGYPVGDRGRLSPDLVRAYEAAHGGDDAAAPSRTNRPRRSAGASGRAAAQGARGRATSRAASATAPGARTVHARTPWDWPRREG